MNRPNQVKIGNDNFKDWLKRLDPLARVEKMSAIAKTQASAGLKGALIKASLAQLSQRCQVMLTKVSNDEIKRLTRRKPVDPKSGVHKLKNKESIKKSSSNSCLLKEVPVHKRNHFDSKSLESKKLSDKKLRKKYQELFGDDLDGISASQFQTVNMGNSEQNSIVSESKVSNYVSTTVNVNIYNSLSDDAVADNTTLVKRKSCSEKSVNSVICGPSKKRLKINVSLSNESLNLKKPEGYEDCINSENPSSSEINRKHDSKPNCYSSSRKNKHKKTQRKSSKKNAVCASVSKANEEPRAVKELWKIFGMESPIDRSESILNSYPKPSPEKTTSLNDNFSSRKNDENTCNETRNENKLKETYMQTQNNIKHKNVFDYEKDEHRARIKSTDIECLTDANRDLSEDDQFEPLCKITETFSLAEMPPTNDPSILNTQSAYEPQKEVVTFFENPKDASMHNSFSTRNATQNTTSLNEIHTISLCDDDEEDSRTDNADQSKNNIPDNKQSKVGSIRVKNIGLLLDPIRAPSTSKPKNDPSNAQTTTTELLNSNQTVKTNISNTAASSVEERFFAIYRYYFNEIESKIVKLGELLHLAIADETRRKERIKRAEQLTSHDLVNEEKQRAENDFNEMVKIRGNEFSPLFGLILNRFEKASKLTLFFALFIRVFFHAQQIDCANEYNIMAAKQVIYAMLTKCQSNHTEVTNVLLSDSKEFMKQVDLVKNLLEIFDKKYSAGPKIMHLGKAMSSTNVCTKSSLIGSPTLCHNNTIQNNDMNLKELSTSLPTSSNESPRALLPQAPVSQRKLSNKIQANINIPTQTNLNLDLPFSTPSNLNSQNESLNLSSQSTVPVPLGFVNVTASNTLMEQTRSLNGKLPTQGITQQRIESLPIQPTNQSTLINVSQSSKDIYNSLYSSNIHNLGLTLPLPNICLPQTPLLTQEMRPNSSHLTSYNDNLQRITNTSTTEPVRLVLPNFEKHKSFTMTEQKQSDKPSLASGQPLSLNPTSLAVRGTSSNSSQVQISSIDSGISQSKTINKVPILVNSKEAVAINNVHRPMLANSQSSTSVRPAVSSLTSKINSKESETSSFNISNSVSGQIASSSYGSMTRNNSFIGQLPKNTNIQPSLTKSMSKDTILLSRLLVNSTKFKDPQNSTDLTISSTTPAIQQQRSVIENVNNCISQQPSQLQTSSINSLLNSQLQADSNSNSRRPSFPINNSNSATTLKLPSTNIPPQISSNSVNKQPFKELVSPTSNNMSRSKESNCANEDGINFTNQPKIVQPNASPLQSTVPSSSHCHPFIRRMPPSGKMKMFFGNKN